MPCHDYPLPPVWAYHYSSHCLPPSWAARYNTGLLIKVDAERCSLFFSFCSFLFFSFLFFPVLPASNHPLSSACSSPPCYHLVQHACKACTATATTIATASFTAVTTDSASITGVTILLLQCCCCYQCNTAIALLLLQHCCYHRWYHCSAGDTPCLCTCSKSTSSVHLTSLYYMVLQAYWRGSALWLS